MTIRQSIFVLASAGMITILVACGGGGGSSGGGGGTTTYTVGGMVSGLGGSGLVLRDNGGDNLTVSMAGAFTFATKLAAGAAYSVTVFTQPASLSQTCVVSNGSGVVGSSNVTNVAVACTTNTYTVGGTVTGLTGTGLILRDNGGDNLNVSAAVSFTFATAVPSGGPYSVTAFAQPTNPNQNCTVANGTGSGTVTNANITTVALVCINVGRFAFVANSGSNPGTVSAFTIDANTGALLAVAGSPFAADTNPWSVNVDPSGKFAYVPNINANHGNGDLTAYTIDATTGALTPIPGSPYSPGVFPQFVTVHSNGKFVYVSGGSNAIPGYAIDSTSGVLSAVAGSPFAAGAINTGPLSVTIDPRGKFAFVPSIDGNTAAGTILAYTIDATTGALTAVAGSPFPAGTYPNVVTIDPSGKFAYVANLDDGDISAYTIDTVTGALTAVPGSPFPAGGPNTFPRFVTIDPTGKFAYIASGTVASGSVWAYGINQTNGTLTAVTGSPFAGDKGAYIVAVDPSGSFAYVTNFYSNNISAYTINAITGALTPVAGSPFATGGSYQSTMSIAFAFVNLDPSGKFLYVANAGSNNVSAFTINATTGALTPVAGSPFAAGTQPHSVTVPK